MTADSDRLLAKMWRLNRTIFTMQGEAHDLAQVVSDRVPDVVDFRHDNDNLFIHEVLS